MNVINLSLGEPEVEPKRDIVVTAIEGAARAGVVPVVAAGNDFSDFGYGSVSSPGNAPSAITVAAVTTDGRDRELLVGRPDAGLAEAQAGRQRARASGSSRRCPNNQGGPWGPLEGTSMASPQVAGGAALLKQQHPGWTVAQIKSALVQTADPVHDGRGTRGVGAPRGRRARQPAARAQPAALRGAHRHLVPGQRRHA